MVAPTTLFEISYHGSFVFLMICKKLTSRLWYIKALSAVTLNVSNTLLPGGPFIVMAKLKSLEYICAAISAKPCNAIIVS